MSKLKPCPFCGSTNLTVGLDFEEYDVIGEDEPEFERLYDPESQYMNWVVVCNAHSGGCGAMGGHSQSRQGAIKAWNRRHVDECHPILEMWLDGVGADAYCSACHEYWGEHESAEALASMLSDYCPDCGSRIDWEHPERVM